MPQRICHNVNCKWRFRTRTQCPSRQSLKLRTFRVYPGSPKTALRSRDLGHQSDPPLRHRSSEGSLFKLLLHDASQIAAARTPTPTPTSYYSSYSYSHCSSYSSYSYCSYSYLNYSCDSYIAAAATTTRLLLLLPLLPLALALVLVLVLVLLLLLLLLLLLALLPLLFVLSTNGISTSSNEVAQQRLEELPW